MDELDISGKRYISSKRAAKENRYHVDYIGQLIRAGKIVGSKVGRTWYVEVESLANYLGNEHTPPTQKVVAQNYKPVLSPSTATAAVKRAEAPVQRVSFQEQEVPEPISYKPVGTTLTYLADNQPAMPRIAKVEYAQRVSALPQNPPEEVVAQNKTSQEPAYPRTQLPLPGGQQTSLVPYVVISALLTLIAVFCASYFAYSAVTTSSGGEATTIFKLKY